MEARELRLGNWVQGKIPFGGIKLLHQVNSMMIRDCEYYKDNWACEPIPLTPEILEKAGFKKGIENYYFKGGVEVRIDDETLDGFGYVPLKYVNQLQNLYFALTGEELEVNL